jgi:predicted acetyltransferase
MEKVRQEQIKTNCEISEPSIDLKDSYLAALREYQEQGIKFDEAMVAPDADFAKFVQHFKDESQGLNITPGRVPQTTYWITDKDGYAGRISIRHELTDALLKMGGNIGYGVIPSKRGLGYGNRALELALSKARTLGLKKVMLSCDSNNIGSKKIIEKNGGVLENEVPGENGKPSKLRYWITL